MVTTSSVIFDKFRDKVSETNNDNSVKEDWGVAQVTPSGVSITHGLRKTPQIVLAFPIGNLSRVCENIAADSNAIYLKSELTTNVYWYVK